MSKSKNKLVKIKSSDRDDHEHWEQKNIDNLANFVHPFTCMICNGKNVGKSGLCKNIIANKDPPFENIIIYTPLTKTTEWTDDIPDCIMITDINQIFEDEMFNKNEKTLLVCDDLSMCDLDRKSKTALSKLIRCESSHNNLSIILINQNIYDILPSVRRCMDYNILFKLSDEEMMKSLCKKIDVDLDTMKYILKKVLVAKGDNILIDDLCPREYRIRKNIYEVIKI